MVWPPLFFYAPVITNVFGAEVKAAILAEIDELIEETTHAYTRISDFSAEHIHSECVAL